MKKKEIYEGTVLYVDFPSKGIVKVESEDAQADGSLVVVKNVIPGQKVRFAICKSRNQKYEGRLLEVVKRADSETADTCDFYGDCGGCVYSSMVYEKQLEMKNEQVKKILDAAINTDYIYEGILASPVNEGYRNKMEYTFGDEYKDGPLAVGLHKRGSAYDIVNCRGCKIVNDDFNKILTCVHEYFVNLNVPFYHKMSAEGYLRHLLIRRAVKTEEILVDLVTTTQLDFDLSQLADKLKALDLQGTITGFLHTYNDSLSDAIKNEKTEIVFGKDYFYEEVLGLKFRINPFSFFQTNTLGAEVLYSKARDYIGKTNGEVVFDLYSGTGTIAQLMAPVAKKVIGVEIVEEAVLAAKENAQLNDISNCNFIAGDVLKVIDEIEEKPDLIILDPPRDGIHPKALPKILSYGVDKIVYISCKVTSLARDLQVMQEMGYKVDKACCVDMFPNTGHVETVCLLSRIK